MMLISRSRRPAPRRALAAALAAGAIVLAGCSAGSMVADHLPNAVGGLPDGTPERPASSMPYPAVNNLPPPRATTVLTDAETKKLESDLVAARNRAAEAAAKPEPAGDADKPAGDADKP
ncbi:MAG: hypothetical protein JO049_10960 [Hyphomicrobiales bacterium]|jgi:hypothetical protein|nr:hypothetical protein [Hyphomicrobiales bacterium]